MKKRMGEESTASREEVFVASESNKKKDEPQENMVQPSSTLLSDNRSEDKKEIEAGEVMETHKSKLRYEDSREKKKLRRDEAPKLLEKEEEKKKTRTHKRLRKRSCSKEKYEFSEEQEEKEIKIRRKLKAESADPESVVETEL